MLLTHGALEGGQGLHYVYMVTGGRGSQGHVIVSNLHLLQLFSQIPFRSERVGEKSCNLIDVLIDIFNVTLIGKNVQVNCKTKFLG